MPGSRDQPDLVPEEVRPPPGHRRFPLCDALRALAALAIVIHHCGRELDVRATYWWGPLVDRLEFGVPVFFLLSGFLLYRPFVAARTGAPAVGLRRYARHRVFRIVPAYWVALTLLAIWPGLPGVFTADWWRFYGFAQIYTGRTFFQGLAPAWSLNVEVVFYLLLPLYVVAMGWLARRWPVGRALRLELGLLVAVLVGASLVREVGPLREAAEAAHLHLLLVYLPRTFDWFLYGLGLAVASVLLGRAPRRALPRWAARWSSASWALAFVAFVTVALTVPFGDRDLQHVLFGPIALLVLLPAVFDGVRDVPQRVLGWRVLAALGLVSYGIFLWHFPLISPIENWLDLGFAGLVVAVVVAAVACGAASYHLLEKRVLAWVGRWDVRLRERDAAAGRPAASGTPPR